MLKPVGRGGRVTEGWGTAVGEFRLCRDEGPAGWAVIGPDGLPVAEVGSYLEFLAARVFSPHTIRAYALDMLCFWRWLEATHLDFNLVAVTDMLAFIRAEQSRPGPGDRGPNVFRLEDGRNTGMTARTINRRLAAIHGFYEHLQRQQPERTLRNPVPHGQVNRAWRMPRRGLLGHTQQRLTRGELQLRMPRRLPRSLDASEVERLIGSLRTHRDKAIALLMLYGGLRSCEVLALGLRDIDIGGRAARVAGKGGTERVVPLDEDVVRAVHQYVLHERPASSEPWLFLVGKGPHRGKSLTAAGLRTIFRYHRVRAGVPAANPHRLRHTFGTNMAEAGVDAHVLKDLMGHRNVDSTQVYVHLSPSHLRRQYDDAQARIRGGERRG